MLVPPPGLRDDDVRTAVVDGWPGLVDTVTYLPVGFGAHHWRGSLAGESRLFVTLDLLGERHDAGSIEAAYGAAAALAAAGLEFVVPSAPTAAGRRTVGLAGGALSVTDWVEGERPVDATGALDLVRRLHASTAPPDVPRWHPLVPPSFADDLAARLAAPWSAGPHAAAAQQALSEALDGIGVWTDAYHRLCDRAAERPWVPTHGEPHRRNLLVTAAGTRLLDWESLKLAPAERDLRVLGAPEADAEMSRLFALEWRLDEIAQYASWFERPHGDDEDDRTALDGLRGELAGDL